MVKAGCVTLDTSHPKSFAFRMTDEAMAMGYTHVWDKNFRAPEEVQWFANKYNLENCDDLSDMAKKIDIGFIQTTNWKSVLIWQSLLSRLASRCLWISLWWDLCRIAQRFVSWLQTALRF